jgi:hypothetical protein
MGWSSMVAMPNDGRVPSVMLMVVRHAHPPTQTGHSEVTTGKITTFRACMPWTGRWRFDEHDPGIVQGATDDTVKDRHGDVDSEVRAALDRRRR